MTLGLGVAMGVEINGFCDERFRPFEEAFRANFDDGYELGAALAVTHQGRTVVDLRGGWADLARTRPWREDTLVHVASTTKVMVALCMLMLVDRGLIELDAPVARYWPEFGQGGKGGVTIREALSHRGGVPGFDPPLSARDLADWDKVVANLAAQPHRFGGEPRIAYHYATYGFLLGEVMRRVDGRRPAQFFREEVASRAGADFHVAITTREQYARLAELNLPVPGPLPEDPLLAYIVASAPVRPADGSFESERVEAPSGSGRGTALSIARIGAIFAMDGTLDGETYVSRRVMEEATTEQAYGPCPYLGVTKLGLGVGLDSPEFPAPSPTCFHWGGVGGSGIVMDRRTRVSIGYAPSNWAVSAPPALDPRGERLMAATTAVLAGL